MGETPQSSGIIGEQAPARGSGRIKPFGRLSHRTVPRLLRRWGREGERFAWPEAVAAATLAHDDGRTSKCLEKPWVSMAHAEPARTAPSPAAEAAAADAARAALDARAVGLPPSAAASAAQAAASAVTARTRPGPLNRRASLASRM